MTNLLGQNVFSKDLPVSGNQVNVSAPDLPSGVYVVKLTQGNQSFSTKLIAD